MVADQTQRQRRPLADYVTTFVDDRAVRPHLDQHDVLLDRNCVFKLTFAIDELLQTHLQEIDNLQLGFALSSKDSELIVISFSHRGHWSLEESVDENAEA